jgi:outer membrane protein
MKIPLLPHGFVNSRHILAIFVIVLVSISPALAQTTAEPKTFTLEQAIEYALAHYPAIRASLEQVNAARAEVSVARAQYLPSLNGIYQNSRATQNQVAGIWLPTAITPTVEGPVVPASGQSFWGSQAAALFSWEPIDFGLRRSMVGQATSAQEKSSADLTITRLQVATAVGNYFLMALANHQTVAAAQANVDRWQVFNRSVHTLVDSELRPGAEASRADAQLALAKTQLYQAQQNEEAALATLAALMGMAGTEIRPDISRLVDLPPSESLPSVEPAASPLAQEQMSVVRQLEAREKVLSRTDYPRIFVQAEGFGRGSEVPNGSSIIGNWNGLAPARGNWIAGFTITFPNVFDFKTLNAEKQAAKANELSQQALYDKTIQDVTGQVRAALAQLKSAQLIAQQTPIELSAARTSETQSRARYDATLATLVEVAAAESLLAQAEIDDAIARLNVWRGLFSVAYAQGNLQPFLDLLRGPRP